MKITKRIVSLVLALLLVFGNVSLLANAALSDKVTVRFKYYREVDGKWEETNKIARGDTVKARLFMDTTFKHSTMLLFMSYPNTFMKHEYEDLEQDPNDSDIYYPAKNAENADAVGAGFEFNVVTLYPGYKDQLTDDGGGEYEPYVPQSYFDAHDWMTSFAAVYTPFQFKSSSGWVAEYVFTVKDDATGEGYIEIPEGSIMAPGEQEAAVTYIAKEEGGAPVLSMNEPFTWDVADDNVLTLNNTVKFDAGEGTLTGTASYEGYIGAPLSDIAGFAVPKASASGKNFLGWTPDGGATVYTSEQVKTLEVDYDEMTLTAVYEAADATYKQTVYTMDTDGNYVAGETTNEGAATNDKVKASDYEVPAGFTLNAEKSTQGEVTVTSDGNAALDIYLTRNKYEIAFGDAKESIYFEKAYTAPEGPKVDGMKFTGWLGADGKTLQPGETANVVVGGMTYTAQYVSAETTVAVKVKYNDRANGGAEKIVDAATVDTIAGYTVALAEAAGDAEKTTYYLIKDLPVIEHYEYDAENTVATVTAAEDGTTVLYAVYKPVNYTATFEGAQTFADVAYYSEITVPAGPVVAGKTFTGWLGSDGTTPAVGTKINVKGDVTYTAQYDDIVYTATYSFTGETPDDAKVPGVASGIKGDEIVLEDPAEVTGWTFNGWTVNGATVTDGKYYFNTSNVTIKGTWTQNVYTATYWLDAAMTEQYDYQEYNYGDIIELLDAPDATYVPAGKEFVEWDCGYASMPAKNIDIIATFNPLYYSVTVKLPDEDPFVLNDAALYGDEITAEELADYEEIEGYTFNGWKVAGKTVNLPYAITGNTVFVADATINAWDLYFWASEEDYLAFEEGTLTSDDAYKFVADITYGSAIDTLTPVGPSKEGHTFATWDMEPTIMEDQDMHFYATYDIESYKVIWDVDGKTYEHNYDYNETLAAPEVSKVGYAFKGWAGLAEDATKMPDIGNNGASITYTAVLEPNTYDAVFYLDAEKTQVHATVPTKYDADIIAPEAPAKAGYDFAGWAPAVGKMDSVDGKEFVATWTAKGNTPYTVNVYTMGTDGEYGAADVKNLTAATDSMATYAPEIAEGFSLNANSVTEGKVTADGKLVLNIWIDRQTFTLTTVVDGKTVETPYLYGAAVAVETPSKVGHSFAWDKAVPSTMPAENVTLNGTFTANQYDLVYMVDGKQHSTEKVTYGTPVTVIAPLTKDGYTFSGWNKTGTFNMPAETVTISGTFTINSYKVIYKVDGNVVHEATAEYNSKVDLYDYTPEEGYTFSGWDKEDGFTMPASEVTVNGTTSKITVTITYKFIGDVPADYPEPAPVTATYGESISKYNNYEGNDLVTGYSSTSHEWSGVVDGEDGNYYVGSEDIVITYIWNRIPVMITTSYTGDVPAGYESSEDWSKKYNDSFTLTAPVEEGYTFKGWTVEGAAEYDAATGTVKVGLDDITITGTWEINKYDVIYMVDGVEHTRVKDVAYGTPVTVLDDLVESGKTFSGWDKEDFVMPDEDVVINGSWTTNTYTVKYYLDSEMNADEVVFDYTGVFGFEYNVPVPTKDGHTFVAWLNADGSDSGLTAGTTTAIPVNGGTYYATWTVNNTKLVYRAGTDAKFSDGTTQKTYDVPYGTAQSEWPVPTEELTRPGYIFNGWNMTSAPATMGTAQVNIAANWDAIPYTVTWINGDAEPVVDDYIYGKEIIAPELEDREGWTFEGWLEADGETYFNDGDTMGEKSLVYTAQWSGNEGIEYTVYRYFENLAQDGWMNGAEAEALTGKKAETVLTGTAGTEAEVDAAAEAVDGFYIDGENSVFKAVIAGDGTTALVIYYYRDTVKVTVKDPDGETFIDDDFVYGDTIEEPDHDKEGYDFIKWVDEEGNTVTFPMTVPATDIVIKPVYEAKKYTITFVDDDNTVIEAAKEVEFGSTIVAPADPEKEGFKFAYWIDADTGAVMPATMPAKNATYKAYYTAGDDTTYFIEVYMMDTNGDYTMASRTAATGTTGEPISVVPGTITGCTYDASLSVLTGIITADGKAALKVYYARNIYTVTFNAADGVFADDATSVGPTDVYFGAAIPVPAQPTREGYDFAGWDKEVPATMPADNLTFNATWTEAEYSITYVVNGTKETVSYKFGEAVKAPADPVVAGMTFLKWDTEIPATMPAEDLVIVAQFEVSVYKATFLVDGVVYDQFMVGHGDEIPVPAENPTKKFYVFTGWSNMPDDGRMPAVDIEITATFERVPVKLVPMAGSTTVIDDDTMAIYGIGLYATEDSLRKDKLAVEGDGYFTVAPSMRTACGTGTVIELYDNVTGELLETYTIVVFGDLNGDSKITIDDHAIAQAEYDWFTSWSDSSSSEYDFYKTMAADFNGDKFITNGEAADIERYVLGTVTIDQTTGAVTHN
ncbi:MAG: InlB B-repeat-containing protein [Clostridia bacterium]|nr:InlB B-repeat-containing protein [Clostridia bacterium]